MEIALYQVDAFADRVFEGNPAAVCPLEEWLPDELMQSIATENNLSETAFFVKQKNIYSIRWFTPVDEVNLCGHATLASAYIIFNILGHSEKEIIFESRSGVLKVQINNGWLEMDFPSQPPVKCSPPEQIVKAFQSSPLECLKSEDYIVVFENEENVRSAAPDLSLLSELNLRGVIITSKAESYDFITRFFAPKYGINEDPVTGSAFTQLIPYWADKTGKNKLTAKQVSQRGGNVRCQLVGDRVYIAGRAVFFMRAVIKL